VTRTLKIFSTIAVQSALETLIPRFEADNGCRLGITWNTAPVLVKRLQGGETADALILNRAGMDSGGAEADSARSARDLLQRSGGGRRQRHLLRQASGAPGNRRGGQRQD
jgi:molybdate transport system substrate-binding protein